MAHRLLAIAVTIALGAIIACAQPPPPPATPATPTAVPTAVPTRTPTPLPGLRIGGLFDLSGPTADLARPYVDAIRTRLELANRSGGTEGRRLELIEVDYARDVVRAVDAYKKLAAQEGVSGVFGWASTDADALSPMLANDRLPYFAASYADSLVERPAGRGYNFLLGATYGDEVRALFRFVKESWQVAEREPSIALVFADDTLGRAPITNARADAGAMGLKVADEQALAPATEDATPELNSVRAKAADFVLLSAGAPLAAVVAKGAAKIGLRAQLLLIGPAVEELFTDAAGPAAENAIGATPFAFVVEDRPGFTTLREAYRLRGMDVSQLNSRHVLGWLNAQMMIEGIKRAGGRTDGESIKRGLETIRDYDTGGATAPITWTAQQHAGSHRVKIYQVRAGRWSLVAER